MIKFAQTRHEKRIRIQIEAEFQYEETKTFSITSLAVHWCLAQKSPRATYDGSRASSEQPLNYFW